MYMSVKQHDIAPMADTICSHVCNFTLHIMETLARMHISTTYRQREEIVSCVYGKFTCIYANKVSLS